jgi:spore coat-associated protein N
LAPSARSSTTSAALPVTSGTVVIALGAAGTATNRLTVGASGLVAGDTVQRAAQLANTGDQNLASITLTTTASPSSLLDTDTTNGLQLVIQACTVPWTEAGVAPAYTYTCGGSTSTVLASRPVIGASLALSNLTATTAGATDNLLATVTLPAAAGNTLQGLSSTITFTFTGTQRAATNK